MYSKDRLTSVDASRSKLFFGRNVPFFLRFHPLEVDVAIQIITFVHITAKPFSFFISAIKFSGNSFGAVGAIDTFSGNVSHFFFGVLLMTFAFGYG